MQRRPLQDDIYDSVVEYITNSALESGARVRDTDVATQLGVSRTPVREALYRLQRDGLIDHPVGRGFRVRPLSMTEAEATYPILWTLEGLALRTSGPLTAAPDKMEELDRLARAIEAAPTALRRVALDNDWHTLLLAGCRNPRLLQMIADSKTVVRRYEVRYMSAPHLVHHSLADHLAISHAALRDTNEAATRVETHWRSALDLLRERITAASAE
jgi:DNA-binding GntR family transcriptional regulator